MSKIDYLKENWGRISVIVIGLITILSISIMIFSLYKEANVKGLPFDMLEAKPIQSIISHNKYEGLVSSLSEPYVPDKSHIRNIFLQYQKELVEVEPVVTEFKSLKDRFKVKKIYKKPVQLLFKGYMQLVDKSYVTTINWADKTYFVKIGDTIKKYKAVDFKKSFDEKETLWGGTERIDTSIVVLERTTGEMLNLEIGHITLEKEIYADIFDRKERKDYDVDAGSKFLDYKVLDISPKEVIIMDQNGVETSLIKEK